METSFYSDEPKIKGKDMKKAGFIYIFHIFLFVDLEKHPPALDMFDTKVL